MARIAWRTAISGFLLLLATYSEGSPAHVGNCFLPSTLATTVPTAADFYNPPSLVRLAGTATTPTTRETFRILATDQIRTGREEAT